MSERSELEEQHVARPPKRMLEVTSQPDGNVLVAINYSSLELIQTCLRKAQYSLARKLRSDDDAPALNFGSAIHKALEHWYTLPEAERELLPSQRERAELLAFGHGLHDQTIGAVESVRQFCLARWDQLRGVPEQDKRSLSNGVKILKAYFKTYQKDALVVARDESGAPLIERSFEFEMHREPGLVIRYHGAIDVILRNQQSGLLLIADHKTTSSLGTEFYARCKPNPQYTGYVMGAQRCLGISTNLFMVNGIQVAKTMQQFARQITTREQEDFDELTGSVVANVRRWLDATASGSFVQAAPNPCSFYGGCTYLPVCSVPGQLRESVIGSKWPEAAVMN